MQRKGARRGGGGGGGVNMKCSVLQWSWKTFMNKKLLVIETIVGKDKNISCCVGHHKYMMSRFAHAQESLVFLSVSSL